MNTTLKMLICCLVMALSMSVTAQDYVQFETIYLKPDTKHLSTLSKNMKAHNDKYHSALPHHANVWQVSNGPKSGWLVWSMGPTTFGHLDSRPGEGGHDEDWANNVMPYVTDMGTIEYWRLNTDVSTAPAAPLPHIKIRFYEVNADHGFLLGDIWEKMGETRKAMPAGRSWGLYNNMLQQGSIGRHFASVTPFANWAELDNGMDLDPSSSGTFRATFEKLNGEGSFQAFAQTMGLAFSDSYDEIWSLSAAMSAPPLQN